MIKKDFSLVGFTVAILFMLALAACNVDPVEPPTPPTENPVVVDRTADFIINFIDSTSDTIWVKATYFDFHSPEGEVSKGRWSMDILDTVPFQFKKAGLYRLDIGVRYTGPDYDQTEQFQLDPQYDYEVDVFFENGVNSFKITKIVPDEPEYWTITTIPDSGDFNGRDFSFSYNAKGEPALVYSDSGATIHYAVRERGSWSKHTVENKTRINTKIYTDITSNQALTFDSSGSPVVAYISTAEKAIYLNRLKEGQWERHMVESGEDYNRRISSFKDKAGRLHLMFCYDIRKVNYSPLLHYRYLLLDENFNRVKDFQELKGDGFSDFIAADRENNPLFLYNHYTYGNYKTVPLNYRAWENGQFITEHTHFTQDYESGSIGGLHLNSKAQASVCYTFNNVDWYVRPEHKWGRLSYATRVDGSWQKETVVQERKERYQSNSFIFDNNDKAIIAFEETTAGDLKIARQRENNDWKIVTVDSAGDVGAECQIAINNSGLVGIVYYDKSNKVLKLAEYK